MAITHVVKSKNITLGGENPILVQTMLKGNFYDYNSDFIETLKYYGCDILRFSIDGFYKKDELKKFIKNSPLPLVLDVKSDKTQAFDALEFGIDAVRINPSLLTKTDTKDILQCVKDSGAIVRIGTNEGSIKGEDAVKLVIKTIEMAEKLNLKNIVLSIKASSSSSTIALNKKLSEQTSYPIHIGLTEAGDSITSAVRSTIVLEHLLTEGIGNTIRYSMAGAEKNEVIAAVELLSSLGKRNPYLHLIVCPSCSRATFLTEHFINDAMDELYKTTYINKKRLTVAIMGCPLNGIGEASNADVGISGTNDEVIIFKKGKIASRTNLKFAKQTLLEAINDV